MAPRMPPTPAAVVTRPITAGETPSCTIRRIATKNIAFTSRFASAPQTASARKYGQPRMKRMPSTTSWCGLRRGPSCCGADRSVRSRPSRTHETAKEIASKANGSQRVTPYRMPPSGPPTSEAMCWRAWLWLSAVDSSSRRTTERIADISDGPERPLATPVSRATTVRCGMVSAPRAPATASEA